jgi:hypothetical protein
VSTNLLGDVSRKGAKEEEEFKDFLCVFAPLRENALPKQKP